MAYRDLAATFLLTALGGIARLEFELWVTRKERSRQLAVLEEIRDSLNPNRIR